MDKLLSEMTLAELWELFPIILSEHKEYWSDWYAEEEKRIKELLRIDDAIIGHIGSTAIDSIWAKPIIDILIEIPKTISAEDVKNILTDNGYICMSESERRISFNKGYTNRGFEEKVFHVHLRYAGDNDELYFRDYLNDNPDVAREYEALKLSLWKEFDHDRDAYTNAKSKFVEQYTIKAKEKYDNCYA